MRTQMLEWLFEWTSRRGGWILWLVTLATVLGAAWIPGLEVTSSYSSLAPKGHPEQVLHESFEDEFGSGNDFVLVLEGDPDATRPAADRLAAEIQRRGTGIVEDVYYRLDLQGMLETAPLYLDVEPLGAALERLSESEGVLKMLFRDVRDLPALLAFFAKGLRGELEISQPLDTGQAAESLRVAGKFFEEWKRWIDDPERSAFGLEGIDPEALGTGAAAGMGGMLANRGYLASRDGAMLFLFVKPSSSRDDNAYLTSLDRLLRESWRAVCEEDPMVVRGVTFGTTGLPAHILADVRSVRSDVARVMIPSAVLVIAILLAGLGSLRRTLLALATLFCSLIVAAAAMRLIFGALNRVSLCFLALLFGIGIDFGIYLIRRTDEERASGCSVREAVRRAVTISGRGILSGGCAVGLAFFGTSFVRASGMAQMGQVAGLGIFVALAVTLLLLPVLLLRFGFPNEGDAGGGNLRAGAPVSCDSSEPAPAAAGGGEKPRMQGWKRLALLFLLLLPAGIGVGAIGRIPLDYNILRLLPKNAESTRYQLRMQEESDFQMSAAFVAADSLEEMRDLAAKISALPEVSRVVSLAQILPSGQDAKLALLRRHGDLLRSISSEGSGNLVRGLADAADCLQSLDEFAEALESVEETAFAAGNRDLVAACGGIADGVAEIRTAFAADEENALGRTTAFERSGFDLLERARKLLRQWERLEPVTEDSLPASLLNRFKSPETGRFLAYVYPSGSMWEIEVLDRFISEVRNVAPALTGYPVAVRTYVRLMMEGLVAALLFSFGGLSALLAADFRSGKKVALTLIPLIVGMLWLQALLVLTGQGYNLASVIGLPLLLGLGVVYGIHIVHRWSENPEAGGLAAVKTSGKAIALAGLTTIAGIVSLIFSLNRAVTSFSLVVLQGILCMLLAALTVLPLVLDHCGAKPAKLKNPRSNPR